MIRYRNMIFTHIIGSLAMFMRITYATSSCYLTTLLPQRKHYESKVLLNHCLAITDLLSSQLSPLILTQSEHWVGVWQYEMEKCQHLYTFMIDSMESRIARENIHPLTFYVNSHNNRIRVLLWSSAWICVHICWSFGYRTSICFGYKIFIRCQSTWCWFVPLFPHKLTRSYIPRDHTSPPLIWELSGFEIGTSTLSGTMVLESNDTFRE
jgi:hypothetical protein